MMSERSKDWADVLGAAVVTELFSRQGSISTSTAAMQAAQVVRTLAPSLGLRARDGGPAEDSKLASSVDQLADAVRSLAERLHYAAKQDETQDSRPLRPQEFDRVSEQIVHEIRRELEDRTPVRKALESLGDVHRQAMFSSWRYIVRRAIDGGRR